MKSIIFAMLISEIQLLTTDKLRIQDFVFCQLLWNWFATPPNEAVLWKLDICVFCWDFLAETIFPLNSAWRHRWVIVLDQVKKKNWICEERSLEFCLTEFLKYSFFLRTRQMKLPRVLFSRASKVWNWRIWVLFLDLTRFFRAFVFQYFAVENRPCF